MKRKVIRASRETLPSDDELNIQAKKRWALSIQEKAKKLFDHIEDAPMEVFEDLKLSPLYGELSEVIQDLDYYIRK